jgi:tetratricopeptide (TPR) repeat protein
MITEQEYKQQINQAFQNKDYSAVINLENDLMFQAYSELAKSCNLPEERKFEVPQEKVFAYFSEHDFAPVLTKKGIAAMQLGDLSLAGQSFEAATRALPTTSTYAEPFFYLCYIQAVSQYEKAARNSITQGLKRDPKLLDNFDALYENGLASISTPESKEEFRKFCQSTPTASTKDN